MSDCSKCRTNKKEDLIGCEGTCKRWWHYSCIKLTDNEFRFLSKNHNVFYLCDSCKKGCEIIDKKQAQGFNDILERIADLPQITAKIIEKEIKAISTKVDDMVNCFKLELDNKLSTITSERSTAAHGKPTYAGIVTRNSTLIITPKDTQQNSNSTKSEILQEIDPVKENLELKQVKELKNGGIAVQCGNDERLKELINSKLKTSYDVKVVSPINPRVRITGITLELESNVLLNMFKSQNKALLSPNNTCQVISVTPLRNNRNVFQTTLQVDATTYHNLIQSGHVIIGYDYCKVYDGIEVRRCFKCCGFHHYATKCTSKVYICPRCAENHKLSDCKSKTLKCFNCTNYNLRNDTTKTCTEHAVWEKSCRTYNTALEALKTNILNINK